MIKKLIFSALTLMISSAAAAQPENRDKVIDEIIAVVAGDIILKSELEAKVMGYAQSGERVNSNTKCLLFEDVLFNKLLIDQAKKDSIEVGEGQISQEIERRLDFYVQQIGSVEKLERFYGKSVVQIKEEFHDLIRDQLIVQRMQQELSQDVKVTPREVREFYHSIPKDSLPYINAEVEAAHIVIKPKVSEEEKEKVRKKLNGFRDRILDGEDFGTLAYLYSEDEGSAAKNGELGYMRRGQLVPEFAEAAFTLEPGQVSPIVESEFGFHIIQLVDRQGQKGNFRHILLKPSVSSAQLKIAKAKLDSIRTELENNPKLTFSEMAEKHSDDEQTKFNDGKMVNEQTGATRFEMDQLSDIDPGLVYALDKLEPGKISEPVLYVKRDKTKAYRIVKLLEVVEPHRANLKDDYQRIRAVAKARKEKDKLDEWIKEKIESTYIKVHDDYRECEFQHSWF